MAKKKKSVKKKSKQGFTAIFNKEENFSHLSFPQILIGLLIFIVSFFIYLKTLTPTVGYHDSGDMTVAAFLLGIPHPPGYPLYCLCGKLFTCIPIGNIAYRLNMISGLFGALTVMMVYFITLKIGSRKWEAGNKENKFIPHLLSFIPAVVASFMLAFAVTFWEQAVIAEKYTLNALFATLLIFILLKWAEAMSTEQKTQNYLYLFSFLLGLAFTHHLQTIFLIPAGIYLVFVTIGRNYKKILNIPFIIKNLIFLGLPLFLYLYLPLRAMAKPLANWGDPSTFERFKEHITAEAYSGFFVMNTLFQNLIEHLSTFFIHQITLLPVIFGLLGGIILFIKRKHLAIFLLIIAIADTIHSIRYTIPNIEDYYIPAFIVISIWIGQGIAGIIELGIKNWKLNPYLYLLFLLLPVLPLLTHYQHNDRSKYYLPYDHCMNILNSLKENALLITKGDDDLFPIWYLQYIEKRREDVAPFNMILFKNPWHIEQNKRQHPYLNLSIEPKRIVKSTNPQGDGLDDISRSRLVDTVTRNYERYPTYSYYIDCLSKNYSLGIEGLLCRVLPSADRNRLLAGLDEHKNWLKWARRLSKIKDRRGIDTLKTYAMTYLNRGTTYFTAGKFESAMEEFKAGIKIQPDSIDLHYNLGGTYLNLGRRNEAINEFKKVLEL
ncbi:MAG: DUF2723 domain-containing protein, partial [bacterium]